MGGTTESFPGCSPISGIMGLPFNVMWQVLPPGNASAGGRRLHQQSGAVQVQFGMNGTSDGRGYIAMGFPSRPGQMTDSNAFILQDCDSCDTGVRLGPTTRLGPAMPPWR